MSTNVKALISKCWKDEVLDLAPGRHDFDEVLTVRISGSIEKQADQMVAPTTSIPLVAALALFWEKSGIARDHAVRMLREAISEAMREGTDKSERIEARIKDVEGAVAAVREELISKLPKTKRSGRVITKDLEIQVVAASEETPVLSSEPEHVLATAAA